MFLIHGAAMTVSEKQELPCGVTFETKYYTMKVHLLSLSLLCFSLQSPSRSPTEKPHYSRGKWFGKPCMQSGLDLGCFNSFFFSWDCHWCTWTQKPSKASVYQAEFHREDSFGRAGCGNKWEASMWWVTEYSSRREGRVTFRTGAGKISRWRKVPLTHKQNKTEAQRT